MRLPAFLLTALFVPVLLPAQTFPSIADVNKSISILQPGMEVQSIAVDATGNVYLAGISSQGFAGATTNLGPRGDADFFVIKTNAAADQILYATSIGGSGTESLRSLKVDTNGNVYLLGASVSTDFPYTSKVNPLQAIGAVALKMNATGTAITYAAQLGFTMTALAMDIDSTGAAYIVGAANAQDIVTSPGALKPGPVFGVPLGDYAGFIVKLAPNGASFQAATYYGAANKNVEAVSVRPNGILIIADGTMALLDAGLTQQLTTTNIGMTSAKMAFDSTGNIHLAGISNGVAGGFLLRKYAAIGQALLLDKTYPLAAGSVSPRIAVTAGGRIILFGQPSAANFPTLNASQTCFANIATPNGIAGLPAIDGSGGLIGTTGQPIPPDQAIMILDPAGNVLHATFTTVVVAQAVVAPSTGRIYTAASQTLFTLPNRGNWRGVVGFNVDVIPANTLSPSCLVHGAYFTPVRLSPGALMTFFGSNLGPTPAATFQLENGVVQKTVGGASITVEGKPAAMLYVSNNQINFVVPWSIRTDGAAVPVCITLSGATKCVQAGTTVATPGALTCFYDLNITCALNQDGSINSGSNGAAPDTFVALYMTGFGTVEGSLVDGGVAGLQLVKGSVTASTEPPPVGGCGLFACAVAAGAQKTVFVDFAGAAPGLVLGANQINIKIPPDMSRGLQTFTISFKPAGAAEAVTTNVKLQIR